MEQRIPSLIPQLVALGNPVITVDGSFLEDNARYIPDSHPGFVVIRFSYKVINRQFTTIAAARILREFKKCVPDWADLPIMNSVVIVTERTIDLFHVEGGIARRDWGWRYRKCNDDGDESDWTYYELAAGPEIVQLLSSRLNANIKREKGLALSKPT